MKKWIFIILAVILILLICLYGIKKYAYSTINYFSKTVENSFNLSLNNIKKKSDNFILNFSPFKCSGERNILCNAKKIYFGKDRYNIQVKNIVFTLTPYYKHADFSFKAKPEYNIFIDESYKKIPLNVECFGRFDLMPKSKYVKMNYWCNTFIANIKLHHTSTMYFKNNVFDKENIYYFSKMFDNFIKEKKYISVVSKTSFGLDYLNGYMQSKDLFNEYVFIRQILNKEYDDTRKTVMSSVENYDAELFMVKSLFGEDSLEYRFIEKVGEIIQNIVIKYHNKISFSIKRKENKNIKSVIVESYKDIYNKLDSSYNFNISSGKK